MLGFVGLYRSFTPCQYNAITTVDGTTFMASLVHQPQAEASDLESHMARTLGKDELLYDDDGKPMLSRRAIRGGLVFCAIFYGIIGAVIGSAWLGLHFL
jgi:hypothetical protein